VFGPFERGSGPQVRAIPGTGLGLTITKLLTEVMGGEINLASTPGQGTTFTVRLLLSEALQDVSTELSRHIRGYNGRRRRIFVVDDDPIHVQFMHGLLVPLGFEVESVYSGVDAVAAAAAFGPDLVLMDLSLPDRTGWEVLRELREHAVLAAVRVLVVSANAHEYAPGSPEALHDGFVMKPVDVAVLLAAVQGQLHLEWIYGSDQAAAEAPLVVDPQLRARIGKHLEELWQLGLIGHVRGIQARLREFEAAEPAATALAQALRAMVERFEMKRYMKTIRELREDG
jgi:CheY-like chemotaxis protein